MTQERCFCEHPIELCTDECPCTSEGRKVVMQDTYENYLERAAQTPGYSPVSRESWRPGGSWQRLFSKEAHESDYREEHGHRDPLSY